MQSGLKADQAGDYVRSLDLYRQAVKVLDNFDARDERRAYTWNALAKSQDALADFTAAESGYRRALQLAEQAKGKSGRAYALALENLAILYTEMRQPGRGERLARQALSLVQAWDPPDAEALAMAHSCVATLAAIAGKYDVALREAGLALPTLESDEAAWPHTVAMLNTTGVALYTRGRYSEAERMLHKAANMIEEHGASDHPLLSRVLSNLGMMALRMGRREEAGETFRRAIEIAERRMGAGHPMYAEALEAYSVYLRETGAKARAKVVDAQAVQIMKDSGKRNGLGAVIDVSALKK